MCNSALPIRFKTPIQSGPSVSAMVSYFSMYNHIPYKRLAAIFEDLFHIPISEGSIDNMLESSMKKAKAMYEIIQIRLQIAK